jgi:cytochrome c553
MPIAAALARHIAAGMQMFRSLPRGDFGRKLSLDGAPEQCRCAGGTRRRDQPNRRSTAWARRCRRCCGYSAQQRPGYGITAGANCLIWCRTLRRGGLPSQRPDRQLTMSSTRLGTMLASLLLIASPARAADFEFGRYLASECMTCHRSATATSSIPYIFGLDERHIADALKAYRDKQLPNQVMQTIAARLSNDEIDALALYFSKTTQPQ